VLVRLFADLDWGQTLRHQPAPWSSVIRRAVHHIVATGRLCVVTLNG
jgi:hypothetical protein